MKYFICFLCIVAGVVLFSCGKTKKPEINDADILHANQDELTQIIIYDVFTPPVAARIYAYTSLASYEAIRYSKPGAESIAEKLNGFGKMPEPEKGKDYNYTLAATKAFCTTAFNIRIFSDTVLHRYEDSVENLFKETLPQDVFERSIALGDTIGKTILARSKTDMYKETRGMPKYLGSDADGKWRPTSPDYYDGVEPFWRLIKPFALDTCSQFRPSAPPPYSRDTNSAFFKMVKEVYTINKTLTDTATVIANFWDDNPFVMQHSGHLMFGNKKITPGGHWMGITAIACKKSNADAVKTAEAYCLTAIALHDGFISCWDAKYVYEYVRPITEIQAQIDKDWMPPLQTPSFPESTAGHATISGSASTVLTSEFGDNFAFHDNSDSVYIGMTRDFNSFTQAGKEAAISRLYGGIHYRVSVDTGFACGIKVGANLLKKIGKQ